MDLQLIGRGACVTSGSDVSGITGADLNHVTDDLVLSSLEGTYPGILRCGRALVSLVHPFTTITDRLDARLSRTAERHGRTSEEHLKVLSEHASLGRLVTAGKIADFVTVLASPLSVALTGGVVALIGVGSARQG